MSEVMATSGIEHAYGLLWNVHTDDQRVHQARRLLLDVIGGQGSPRQREGIEYVRRTELMVSALEEIATGEIVGEPTNYSETLAIVRQVARAALPPDSLKAPSDACGKCVELPATP